MSATPATCPHGYPTPKACVDCMADGPMPAPPRAKREGWPFTASLSGPCCAGCPSGGIEPGDRIVHMSDDTYRHVGACEKGRPRP